VAASYLEREERWFLYDELIAEESLWPDGAFRRALVEAAVAIDEEVALSVARFAAEHAPPRTSVLLKLRARADDELEDERGPSWRLLETASPSEIAALQSIADEWLVAIPLDVTPTMRFRASLALLERGSFDARHDALLPDEMIDWAGDLAAGVECGLCGEPLHPGELPHEPALGVVLLLARLPPERYGVVLARAARSEARRSGAMLIGAWLDLFSAGQPEVEPSQRARLAALPDLLRTAIELAWSRLAVAPHGALPRLLQQEVLASFAPRAAAPRTCDRRSALCVARDRTLRLVELHAPIQVLMRDASIYRTLEWMIEDERDTGVREERAAICDDAWRHEIMLSALVLARLDSKDERVAQVLAELYRIARADGDSDDVVDWENAEALEAEWEATPTDPGAAVGHYAFCALDVALGEGRRTDQDDLHDIAERAFLLAKAAELGGDPHASELVLVRREWWSSWLLELAPEAYGDSADESAA